VRRSIFLERCPAFPVLLSVRRPTFGGQEEAA
jgi:hypothetical protein